MGNLILQSYPRLPLTSSSTMMMNPRIAEKLTRIKYYFASRTSAYDDIWNICYRLSDEINEQVLDVFILTFVDHWDKEKERYVLLCERCLILMDFDFERLETKQLDIYDYARFNSIKIGPFCYPQIALNYYNHRCKYAMRFQWDSQKPLNYREYWNPWSKEIPWITLTQHPLAYYIDDLLNELSSEDSIPSDATSIDDQYFTKEYLEQIRRRFSIETFHDKLMEIMNSLQRVPVSSIPLLSHPSSLIRSVTNENEPLTNLALDEAVRQGILFELFHNNNHDVTIVHYAPVICENYFNIPAMFFNRINLGYYRLRLF